MELNMNRIIAVVFLLAGLASFSAQSLAQPGYGRGAPPAMDNLAHLDMLADQIGLTEEQGEEITRLVNVAQLESAVDRERMQQIREELRAMVDSFDASQAQILADELGEISARLAYNAAERQAAIRQIFTADQILMLEELRAEHKSQRNRSGEDGHSSSGRGGRGFPRAGNEN
jgi:Spy/CpxP family protein refolding chaperone